MDMLYDLWQSKPLWEGKAGHYLAYFPGKKTDRYCCRTGNNTSIGIQITEQRIEETESGLSYELRLRKEKEMSKKGFLIMNGLSSCRNAWLVKDIYSANFFVFYLYMGSHPKHIN